MMKRLEVKEFASVKGGKRLPKGHSYSESKTEYPYLRVVDFGRYTIDNSNLRFLKQETHKAIRRYVISKEDVYISIAGTIGRVGWVPNFLDGANLTENAAKITEIKGFNIKYLVYFLSSIVGQSQISLNTKATSQPKLALYRIESIGVPLFPFPEQRAIVAKIEQLFSELDNGIANLKRAQEQLKVYRQAVLKKAFEGDLTKAWRAQQTDLPTAEDLLEQIKAEREAYYQQQLKEWVLEVEKWETNGKGSKKPAKPKSIKFFNEAEIELNLKVPSGWTITCLGNLSSGVEYGTSAKSTDTGLIPVIRMGNMQNGKIDWNDLKYTDDQEEIYQYILKEGDVLFNRTNSPELVGKTVYYRGERPALFAGYLIRINHIRKLVSGEYVNYFLNSHSAKVYGAFVKTDGVNQSNINGQKLSNYPFPICSFEEQKQIVQEIESRLSVCDKVEATIQESLEKAEALRQSILKQAFEGKLLTEQELQACREEVDWEPAENLLERIKAEKAGAGKKKQKATVA
jgi:type I restriction enzyme S subunit